ncbi:MAG: hypothetical protein LBS69_03770, partial [Prevotellaceae bacterium]|nr:hypothetical protein [Prevotellaceae bacterium]
ITKQTIVNKNVPSGTKSLIKPVRFCFLFFIARSAATKQPKPAGFGAANRSAAEINGVNPEEQEINPENY